MPRNIDIARLTLRGGCSVTVADVRKNVVQIIVYEVTDRRWTFELTPEDARQLAQLFNAGANNACRETP